MDLLTVRNELVKYYRAANVASKAKELMSVLEVALRVGGGRPMPKELFSHVFGATLCVVEARGIEVTNRRALENSREGFEFILALVDERNPEHATALEVAAEKEERTVQVAQLKRPESQVDYGLPAGAEDLTNTVTKDTNKGAKA